MLNPIELSLFANRLNAVCQEMGAQLKRAAFSPNIRDRLDYSCAVFDAQGELAAQAAHIPVHLGSMAFAMSDIVNCVDWQAGDVLVVNDPYQGGTHLPDVTVVSPAYSEQTLTGFVVNRAHHADIGAESPGSMPVSCRLEDEGLIIPPSFLYRAGAMQPRAWQRLADATRNPAISLGDFQAQISANRRGLQRLQDIIGAMGLAQYQSALAELNDYAERLAGAALAEVPAGEYRFRDVMDDDGQGQCDIPIVVRLACRQEKGLGRVDVDFSGTAPQVRGNINCPLAVVAAAVFYVFRCIMPLQTPACAGALRPLRLTAPRGCLLNAEYPAAVAAGNVETSMRVADVVLGALAQALPERIPAASGGSMNNVAFGAGASEPLPAWDYYETIGNGAGASAAGVGISAVQTHMTNTLNTPIEVIEMAYPLRVIEYSVRRNSGGRGHFNGGDGIVREIEFLAAAAGTVLSERRRHPPWGLAGGGAAQAGINSVNGQAVAAKMAFELQLGDRLRIETPGGGAFGSK